MALFGSKRKKNLPARRQSGGESSRRATPEELSQRYTFRRNQTLTGSASSNITAPSEQKAHLKSPRVQAHDLVRTRRKIFLLFLAVSASALGLYVLSSQFTGTITIAASDTSIRLDSDRYKQAVEKYLASVPVQRLRFLTNRQALLQAVQRDNPEVQNIVVEAGKEYGATKYTLQVRRPVVGWAMSGRQYYVDAEGVAFLRNYYASPAVSIVDESGVPATSQTIASNRFLSFVGRIVGESRRQGFTPEKVIIPSDTSRQVELQLKDLEPRVIVSVDRPAGQQAEDMQRAVTWFRSKNQTPQYIDIRVANKVFYR